ncbi:hypothetical protein ACFWRC_19745 [Streptomyces albidoflavus]
MRSLLRYVTWRLTLASSVADYYAECLERSCRERSPTEHATNVDGGPEDWCIDHSAKHPSHRAFRAVTVSAWRTEPDDTVGSRQTAD